MSESAVIVVKNDWDKLAEALGPNVDKFLDSMSQKVFEKSQQVVPVDKGDLKASGQVRNGDTEHTRIIAYGTDHAWYVEFGTRNMSAEPYLIPSVVSTVNEFQGALKGVVDVNTP